MNVENMQEMVKNFEVIVTAIEKGKMSIPEVKNALHTIKVGLDQAVTKLEALADNKTIDGMTEVEIESIKLSLLKEREHFKYKENKKKIVQTLELLASMDERIETPIFLDFFKGVFIGMEPAVSKLHPEGGKAIRKAIKKFNKIKKERKEGK